MRACVSVFRDHPGAWEVATSVDVEHKAGTASGGSDCKAC